MTPFRPALACALLLALTALPVVEARPGKKPAAKPSTPAAGSGQGLQQAVQLLTTAKQSAEKDHRPEFGGHRAAGVKHIESAMKVLHASIKAVGKTGKGGKAGKGKGKGGNAGTGKGNKKNSVARALADMDTALKEFGMGLRKYDAAHKGKGGPTGLHHAEQLVRQARAAAAAK
jgi:hypothetical protein